MTLQSRIYKAIDTRRGMTEGETEYEDNFGNLSAGSKWKGLKDEVLEEMENEEIENPTDADIEEFVFNLT